MKKRNNLQGDIQELIPIQKIDNGSLILKNQKRVTVFKVEPTNFRLKTILEQEAILEDYKLFLKRCNFDIQIIVQTQKRELGEYIKNLKDNLNGNEEIREMLNDYINFLKEVVTNKEIVSKNFYILVETSGLSEEEVFMKISESLRGCDNEVRRCNNQDVLKIMKNYLNK